MKNYDNRNAIYDRVIDEYIESEGLENQQSLVPSHLRREKIRNEIKAEAESGELRKYLKIAFQTLIDDGQRFVELKDYENMINHLYKSTNYLKKTDKIPVNLNFKTILHFNEYTMETIFKIAQGTYNDNKLDEALSIFALLTALAPEDPDYLYRLGIVARQTNRLELALSAFINAVSLDPDFVSARLYASECYLKLDQLKEAKHEFEEAKKRIDKTAIDPLWSVMISQLKTQLKETPKN